MTEPIFFDTDCLSAFLWVGKENLVVRLYKARIILPQQVYDEIKKVRQLKTRIDNLSANHEIAIQALFPGTPEAELYFKLIDHPTEGYKKIGRGEASAIALARYYNGILASNNLRDIRPYITLYQLKHVTTGDIMEEALNQNIISEKTGNGIWQDMRRYNRMLPAATFSEFLAQKRQK